MFAGMGVVSSYVASGSVHPGHQCFEWKARDPAAGSSQRPGRSWRGSPRTPRICAMRPCGYWASSIAAPSPSVRSLESKVPPGQGSRSPQSVPPAICTRLVRRYALDVSSRDDDLLPRPIPGKSSAGEIRPSSQAVLPLLRPATITVMRLTTVATWNNFFLPLAVIRVRVLPPVTVGIYQVAGALELWGRGRTGLGNSSSRAVRLGGFRWSQRSWPWRGTGREGCRVGSVRLGVLGRTRFAGFPSRASSVDGIDAVTIREDLLTSPRPRLP